MPEKEKQCRDTSATMSSEPLSNNQPAIQGDTYMEALRLLALVRDANMQCADVLRRDAAMATIYVNEGAARLHLYNLSKLTVDQ